MTWRRFHHGVVDSTNERAFDALERGGARHGDMFIAASQTAGRGTHGRTWESAPGGLYVSVILESRAMPPPGAWTVAGALAVHDVATQVGVKATLDWPNDLVSARGQKLAGVLAESRGLKAGGPAVFVLGVGVNVEGAALSAPLRDERPVTSLRELGAGATVLELEDMLADALERRVEDVVESPGAVYGEFFERCTLAHRGVVVSGAEREVRGTWTALDPSLGIRVEGEDGRVRHVSVAHVRGVRSVSSGGTG